MDPLLWGLLLLAAGILLLIAEFFLPSGGALAVASAACIIAALVVPFFAEEGSWWRASVVLLVALVGVPITLRATIDLWPRSAFGRLLLIELPKKPDDVLPEEAVALRSLVGSVGVAKSPMRPSGTVSIGGAYYHATSEGMPIEKGERVKTVAVRMRQLIVVPAREADLAAAEAAAAPALASPGRATPTKAFSATFEDSATRAADLAPADALTKSDDLAASIDSLDLFDAGKSSEDDLSSRK
jgi:membrane protein implicated in regulation of membrane protease activity